MTEQNNESPVETPRSSITLNHGKGSVWGKLETRVKEEPLVFVFAGLTVAALAGGLTSLAKNNKQRSQTMMRLRVLFQLSAVGTLIGSMYMRMKKEGAFKSKVPLDLDPVPPLVSDDELLGFSSDTTSEQAEELK